MSPKPPPSAFQNFYYHVFGDTRYYYYGGIPESVCTRLEGLDRQKAEQLVLRAIKRIRVDERSIKAAGYLRLQAAAPILEKKLVAKLWKPRPRIRSIIIWAIFKINDDKKQRDNLIDFVNNGSNKEDLTRVDAADLLSDFGKEPVAVECLCRALLDDDRRVADAANFALRKIFQDDSYLLNFLHGSSRPLYERRSAVVQIKRQMGM